MRFRVILLVLAIASLILVSFMLPLALLLRQFAYASAMQLATIRAQTMAILAPTLQSADLQRTVHLMNQANKSEPITIFLPDGQQLGFRTPRSKGVKLAAGAAKSFPEQASGGMVIYVAGAGMGQGPRAAVIRTFVPNSQLRRGVIKAWLLLAAVAIGLLAMAVIVAAQLARNLVRPLANVAMAADLLAQGELTARAPVEGTPEIRQVSNGLNRLAARIGEQLAHERETLAGLSHRLRTPLTALRIDAETLSGDEEVMTRVIGDVDALTRTVNEIIAEARRPSAENSGATCDAASMVRERAAYWRALAEDQERWMTVEIPPYRLPVRGAAQDLTACVEILLENVFAPTPHCTPSSARPSHRTAGGPSAACSH